MINPPGRVIRLPLPRPRPPEDDPAVHPDLIVPSQIWLESPLPKRQERPLAEVIRFPTTDAPRPESDELDPEE